MVHGGFSISERNQEVRMLLRFFDAKHLCIANTLFIKAEEEKITCGIRCDVTLMFV